VGSLTLVSTTARVATVNMDTINSGAAPDDWGIWDTGALPPDQRRNGGGATLSVLTLVGTGPAASSTSEPVGVSWTNGTPTASGSTVTDLFNSSFGAGEGFTGTLPADTNLRTAWFLVGPYNTTNGTMVFSLSDGSAATITNTTALVATSGAFNPYLVTVTYQANSPSQTLSYTFTSQGASTVTLQAIAVAKTGAAGPAAYGAIPQPGPGIGPSPRQQFFRPARDTTKVAAAPISGSAAVVEGLDIFTASGTVGDTGAAAIFEALDIASLSGSLSPAAVAVLAPSGPGISPNSRYQFSTLALSTQVQITTSVSGSIGVAEPPDGVAFSGTTFVTGTVFVVEGADPIAVAAALALSGSAAIVESTDTAVLPATLSVSGTAAILERADNSSFSGASGSDGLAAIIEAGDIFVAPGSLSVSGPAGVVELPDIILMAGSQSITGTMAILEGRDPVTALGAAGNTASAAIVEPSDIAQFLGSMSISGSMAVLEGPDDPQGFASSGNGGAISGLEGPDIFNAFGTTVAPQPPHPGLIGEFSQAKTPLGAALDAGVATLSYGQQICFTLYLRVVLPADGFVFWVKARTLSKNSAAYNNALGDTIVYNAAGNVDLGCGEMCIPGSLHFSTMRQQDEASSAATNTVVFTAREPVQNLDLVGPNMMWVAQFGGVKFAFRDRTMFYKQAGLHHYRGTALYSTLDTQLIDSVTELPTGNVVSDSLPLWLTMSQYGTVYPSFAVPANLPPPYIGAHIVPGNTRSLAMQPWIDPATGSSWQLTRDTVRFTLYGLQNNAAIDFQNYIFNGSLDDNAAYGILGDSMPTLQDERQTQPEMQILAQRKTFTVDVSYYQTRVQTVALRYILSAMLTLNIGE
jgi:hypothetical protein